MEVFHLVLSRYANCWSNFLFVIIIIFFSGISSLLSNTMVNAGSGPNAGSTYARDGKAKNCFKGVVRVSHSNFVYQFVN